MTALFSRVRLAPALLIVAIALPLGCSTTPDVEKEMPAEKEVLAENATPPTTLSLNWSKSTQDTPDTVAMLKQTLEGIAPISIVAELDHAQNAGRVELELPPTQVVFFGNPKLGTPLMQKNQTAGLDLPQRVLVYEQDGTTYVVHGDTSYLSKRHGLSDVASLTQISGALEMITKKASGAEVVTKNTPQEVTQGEGIVTVKSNFTTDETYQKLKEAIQSKEPLTIVFELDHAQNAKGVDLELRPTKLIAFGNPKLGTPLISTSRTLGFDLPQKVLVWEDEQGDTYVSYNDPAFLAKRHGISSTPPQLETIANALAGLTKSATSD